MREEAHGNNSGARVAPGGMYCSLSDRDMPKTMMETRLAEIVEKKRKKRSDICSSNYFDVMARKESVGPRPRRRVLPHQGEG